MSEQPQAAATRPPLVRPRQGRMVFGVCAGLARSTDVDPVIYRVVAVVLTIFGGVGVLIYALGWLLIPEEGAELSEAERLIRRHRHQRHPRLLVITAAVVTIIWLASVVRHGHDLGASVVLIAILAYLLLRDRGPVGIAPPPPADQPEGESADAPSERWWSQPARPSAPAGEGSPIPPPAPTPPLPPLPSLPPLPPRPPGSRLGWITLSVALVVAGALVAAREAGAHHLTVTHILAAMVLVIGLGLVVGSVLGRARWLALPGGALAAAMLTLVGIGVPLDGGVGDHVWHPTTGVARHYHLGIGHAVLDLRDAPLTAATPTYIDASVAVGQLEVLVPDSVTLQRADTRAAVGHLDVFGTIRAGIHPHLVTSTAPVAPSAAGQGKQLLLRLRVGAGDVEVRHVAG